MKHKALILMALLLPLGIAAQSDSAAIRIVERYLDIMNIKALPTDSMLVVNTQIIYPQSGDTMNMKRLYAPPQMFRIEVYDNKGLLQTGLCGNGGTRGYVFSSKFDTWRTVTSESFFERLSGFDVRGPLYNWQSNNAYLTYRGKTEYKGQYLDAVYYTAPGAFKRTYFFEESGMLSLIVEEDSVDEGFSALRDAHIDWKCIHEYSVVGPAILPSLESFMRENTLTVMRSEMHLEKRDDQQFTQD